MKECMKISGVSCSGIAVAMAIVGASLITGCAHEPKSDTPASIVNAQNGAVPGAIATVNGVAITSSQVDEQLRRGNQADSPAQREAIVRGLIVRELIRQAAESENLGEATEVRAVAERSRVDAENQLYVARHLQVAAVTDDEVRQRYDAAVSTLGPISYKPRVIVLPDDRAAQDALTRLARGEAFDKLAATSSIAPNKVDGGALPWVSLKTPVIDGQTQGLPLGIASAIAKLRPGQYTRTPVALGKNFALVKLDATQPTSVPPFAQVRDSLKQSMQAQAQERAFGSLVDSLAKKAVITRR
jgi:parvulin-like peptidyl-prolyl isomerase